MGKRNVEKRKLAECVAMVHNSMEEWALHSVAFPKTTYPSSDIYTIPMY